MLRSCGLGETQQVDRLCGVLEGIAKQEVMILEEERGTCAQIWRTLDELYGDKARKLRVDFFAARQNRDPPVAPLLELDSWKNSIWVELAKELQEQMRELGEGLKKDSTNHGPAYVGTTRGAPSAHNVAGVATSAETASNREARGEWDKAFAVCRKVEREEDPDGKVGTARLTRQQPIQIPPQSEMVVWTRVIEHRARTEYCALVEAIEEDAEWQVARTLAWSFFSLARRGRCVTVVCLPAMAKQNHGEYQSKFISTIPSSGVYWKENPHNTC
ncbi:UNVERIFIED_CONTAM: hypothetical protein FKN15_002911 [Acipenser sinensis]